MKISLLLSLVLALSARADIIHLKTGKVEGTVVQQDAARVVVQTKVGKVTFSRSDVVRIEKKVTPVDTYRKMTAEVGADDADGHFSIGRWCTDHHLSREARFHYEKVLAIDPNHAGARQRLGFVLKDGKWMTRSQAKEADGLVQHNGKWMTAEERDEQVHRKIVSRLLLRLQYVVANPKRSDVDEMAERFEAALGRQPGVPGDMAVRSMLKKLTREAGSAKRDRTYTARAALLTLLARQGSDKANELVRRTAIIDPEPTVREAAVHILVRQKDVANTAWFVRLLRVFAGDRYRLRGSRKTRGMARRGLYRAAEALGSLGDPRAIPALANSMIVRFHIATDGDEIPPMSLGFSAGGMSGPGTLVTDGRGNQFVVPITENTNWGLGDAANQVEDPTYFNEAAYSALRSITRQDFGQDKRTWLSWWYRNRHE
ncbi:hypothetical protein HQ560_09960, partial [bacterium]|nr:hypothetical protein [bacterium]